MCGIADPRASRHLAFRRSGSRLMPIAATLDASRQLDLAHGKDQEYASARDVRVRELKPDELHCAWREHLMLLAFVVARLLPLLLSVMNDNS